MTSKKKKDEISSCHQWLDARLARSCEGGELGLVGGRSSRKEKKYGLAFVMCKAKNINVSQAIPGQRVDQAYCLFVQDFMTEIFTYD